MVWSLVVDANFLVQVNRELNIAVHQSMQQVYLCCEWGDGKMKNYQHGMNFVLLNVRDVVIH